MNTFPIWKRKGKKVLFLTDDELKTEKGKLLLEKYLMPSSRLIYKNEWIPINNPKSYIFDDVTDFWASDDSQIMDVAFATREYFNVADVRCGCDIKPNKLPPELIEAIKECKFRTIGYPDPQLYLTDVVYKHFLEEKINLKKDFDKEIKDSLDEYKTSIENITAEFYETKKRISDNTKNLNLELRKYYIRLLLAFRKIKPSQRIIIKKVFSDLCPFYIDDGYYISKIYYLSFLLKINNLSYGIYTNIYEIDECENHCREFYARQKKDIKTNDDEYTKQRIKIREKYNRVYFPLEIKRRQKLINIFWDLFEKKENRVEEMR